MPIVVLLEQFEQLVCYAAGLTWNDPIIAQKFRGEPSENAQEHLSLCEIMFNDVLNALMGKHEVNICEKV